MNTSITTLRSNRVFDKRIENLGFTAARGIRQGFFRLGAKLVEDSKRIIIKGPKTGRLYRIKGRKRRHRASAPGEAPANLSGALKNSMDFKIHGSNYMEFGSNPNKFTGTKREGSNQSTSKYAEVLENPRKLNRPYIEPTVRSNQRNAQRYFEAEIEKAYAI